MDSTEFLVNFHFPKPAHSKRGHRKRHSFKGKWKKKKWTSSPINVNANGEKKTPLSNNNIRYKMELCQSPMCSLIYFFKYVVMRSMKTVPWIQGRSKVTPAVSEQSQGSTSGGRTTLRRSLGLETFPSVLLFRTCMPCAGKRSMKKERNF